MSQEQFKFMQKVRIDIDGKMYDAVVTADDGSGRVRIAVDKGRGGELWDVPRKDCTPVEDGGQ